MEEFTFISPGYSTMLGQTENRLSLFTLGQKEKMKLGMASSPRQGRAAFRFTHREKDLATVMKIVGHVSALWSCAASSGFARLGRGPTSK